MEELVDMREMTEQELIEAGQMAEIVFKLNHTLPNSEEYNNLLKELLGNNLGENSTIIAPIAGAAFDHIKIGDNVFINSNILLMARGGITIEDDVMIAGNVQLLSNNHDEYDRQILICKPILIKKGSMDWSWGKHIAWSYRWKVCNRWCRSNSDKRHSRLCSCSRFTCESC